VKEIFQDLKLRPDNMDRLTRINGIIEEFQGKGYRLTLRQLYYQLVSRDVIANTPEEYKKLGGLLVKGRMAGVVDWDAIEDRIRVPKIPYWVNDIEDALNDTIRQYRLDRMEGQDYYIEVWCEKDALSGIILRVTEKFHIRLMINRGYSSASAMYRAAKRFQSQIDTNNKLPLILYLGDHDPSGLDMVRDIRERLEEFGIMVEINHIALTSDQIAEFNPPPNPAKITDPRADWYIRLFGDMSWEVDALSPEDLTAVLNLNINNLIDTGKFADMIEKEKDDKDKITEIIDSL